MELNFNKVVLLAGAVTLTSYGCRAKSSEQARPNILFVIADDMSFPHAGIYGCSWVKTPAFDQVASNGLLFNNAYTPNAKSAPSRASVLTGLYSWQLEEASNHIGVWPENKFPTFCETLVKNGYYAGFTGKGWEPGDPGVKEGKKRLLTGIPYQKRRLVPPTKYISQTDYAGNFADFLVNKPQDKPWVFWYGGREPHRKYEYGTGSSIGGKNITEIDKVPDFWPDNHVVRNDMLDYAFEIEHFDSHLGRMIKMLEEKGELSNTIIIVTADNGMPFPRSKGLQYEYSTHLPLAIMWPEGIINPGRYIDDYVSFVDIAPTLLNIAKAKNQEMHPSGKDMTDLFRDDPDKDRSYILLGQERHDYGRPLNQGYPIRSIIEGGYLYIYNFKPELWPAGNPETGYLNTDGSPTKTEILQLRREGSDIHYWNLSFGKNPQEELYNIATDRECLINLAGNPLFLDLKEKLKSKLFRDLRLQNDPRVSGNGDIFDKYPFMNQSSYYYYERYMNKEIKAYQTDWVESSDYEKEIVE